MDATRWHQGRWWAAAIAAVSMWAVACAGSDPAGAPSVVPTASPYAVLPAATIVAKAPPPTAPPTLTPRPSPTPEVEQVTYRIVAGDNPGSIAARFDISTAELLKANNITNPSTLQIGQTLVIPVTPTPRPTPSAGPPPAATATPRGSATATQTATPTATRPPGTQTYAVKSGDTASGIASSYAITVAELATLNSTSEAALRNLQIGQQLVVPATPSSTPAPAPSPSATPGPGATATPTPTAPASGGEVYIVKAGDTALDIAALLGISIAQLAAANDTTPAALGTLKIGQRLAIPTRGVG